ncbi:MAG: hypothetical protein CME70_11635 [Halobacteriovorax sp.]|nr:hypothetical protein [Halobacteriovorax sp.]|tara:strand:+ start:32171 stop:32872 length:702 start_codon:yes stop_codon:yes gene_type:complete
MKLAILLSLIFASCSQFKRAPSSVSSVLYIGDSQSEGFLGGMVYKHLKESSKIEEVRLYGVGSSSPRHWGDERDSKNSKWLCKRNGRKNDSSRVPMKNEVCLSTNGDSAFKYLNRKKPQLVIFQFLGNSMGFNENYISKKVGNLLGALSDEQQCLFITSPPYYKDLIEKNKLRVETQEYFLKAIGSRCKVLKGVTEESLATYAHDRENYLGDRIHLSKKGASEFFKMILPLLP